MKTKYICTECGKDFNNAEECLKHELTCNELITFKCDKCGKVLTYKKNDYYDFTKNECWNINLGQAGYGSLLDGCRVSFKLCDDCLTEFVKGLKKDKVDMIYGD